MTHQEPQLIYFCPEELPRGHCLCVQLGIGFLLFLLCDITCPNFLVLIQSVLLLVRALQHIMSVMIR